MANAQGEVRSSPQQLVKSLPKLLWLEGAESVEQALAEEPSGGEDAARRNLGRALLKSMLPPTPLVDAVASSAASGDQQGNESARVGVAGMLAGLKGAAAGFLSPAASQHAPSLSPLQQLIADASPRNIPFAQGQQVASGAMLAALLASVAEQASQPTTASPAVLKAVVLETALEAAAEAFARTTEESALEVWDDAVNKFLSPLVTHTHTLSLTLSRASTPCLKRREKELRFSLSSHTWRLSPLLISLIDS